MSDTDIEGLRTPTSQGEHQDARSDVASVASSWLEQHHGTPLRIVAILLQGACIIYHAMVEKLHSEG